MDEIMNKVGSYWLSQKANKEISSVGDDFDVSSPFLLLLLLRFDASTELDPECLLFKYLEKQITTS